MNNQLLKVEQVADAIGVTPKTIRLWCQAGDVFPTARKLGNRATGQWRILSDDVALLEMLSGHAENAAILANQNQRIDDLERQLQECHANYQKLMAAYETSLTEQNQLEEQLKQTQHQLSEVSTENQRFREWYDEYDQKRQQQRRAA